MRRSSVIIGCVVTTLVVLTLALGVVMTQIAKHDAVTHLSRWGATDAHIQRIRPSLRHGLWMEVRVSGPDVQIGGMYWYAYPWRDWEIIKY